MNTIPFPHVRALLRMRIFLLGLFPLTGFGKPVFTQQPADATIVPEQTACFAVAASGSGTISYQWYRNGVAVEGATGVKYYAYPTTAADDGSRIHVVATDSNGATASRTAVIHISEYTSQLEMSRPSTEGADFYLDAVNGNDSTGDGSESAPYKTFNKIRGMLRGGEVVVFHSGNYGDIRFEKTQGTPVSQFTDWVSLVAAPGAQVEVDQVALSGNWETNRISWDGNFDLRLRVIGMHIMEGVSISGINYARIEDCLINLPPPWSGSVANVDRSTVGIRGARSITVEDCEITDTAIGLGMRGNDLTVRRNHIHHISHDGIRLTGCDVVHIDNNRIYNSDDGADDSVAWARHADGMHFFKENDSSTVPIDHNNNIYVRGNQIYHHESMCWMAQGSVLHRNWVVENNIFGPSGGFMLHLKLAVDGFIFRHNTIIYDDVGSYQGIYRTLDIPGYEIALPCYESSNVVEIYNNILLRPTSWGQFNLTSEYCEVYTHNYFHHRAGTDIDVGENPLADRYPPFLNSGYDALLREGTTAINGGTTYKPVAVDFYGVPRSSPPTVGATEFVSYDDTSAPTTPMGLTATADGDRVELSWDASSDDVMVAGYTLYRNGEKLAETHETIFTDILLQEETEYSYAVAAYDPARNQSTSSDAVQVTTGIKGAASPTARVVDAFDGLVLSASTPASASANMIEFDLGNPYSCAQLAVVTTSLSQYSLDYYNSGSWIPISGTSVSGNSDSERIFPIDPVLRMSRIRMTSVEDLSGLEALWLLGEEVDPGSDFEAPSIPTGLVGTAGSGQVNLTWEASTDNVGVAGYVVYRDGNQVGIALGNQFLDTGLLVSKTYSYSVAAFDEAGNVSLPSQGVNVTTQAAASSWAGYPEDEYGFINTGFWMGYVYTPNNPWIWVYPLQKWIYAPDPGPETGGAWGYFKR